MSKKKEETVPAAAAVEVRELKPEVKALSEKITKGLKGEKSDGRITETADNYKDNLPEGITPEIDTVLNDYQTRFVAASAHSVGLMAADLMKSNKKLDEVTATIKMAGKNEVNHAVARSKTFAFGSGDNRREVNKPGAMETKVDIYGAHNSGQLKIARETVGALFSKELAK